MPQHSQFIDFGVELELKDGKKIIGKISKASTKGLSLYDVEFGDGTLSPSFKVRASRLKDLRVLSVANKKNNGNGPNINNNNNNATRKNKNGSGQNNVHVNGNTIEWQGDDVKMIKEQEDFDFQGNLNMFNKKDVFAKLREQDEIDPSNRLVSHNRKQSGTSSPFKEKYDIDEMVIPNAKDDSWNKITGQKPEGKQYDNVKSGSESEKATEEYDSDVESDSPDTQLEHLPVTNSINITHLLHSAVEGDEKSKSQEELLSKLQKMIISQTSQNSKTPRSMPFNLTLKNKKTKQSIPMATPVQLLEMERLAQENFDISINSLNDIFALNSSYFIKQKLGGGLRLTSGNSNPEPLVVIFACDSNRSGLKALTLGRFLCQNLQVRVITLFTSANTYHQNEKTSNRGSRSNRVKGSNSDDNSDDDDAAIKRSTDMFVKCGGKVVNSLAALDNILKKLNSPIELIVDAMQGFDCNLIDFDNNQRRITDMVTWCNDMIARRNIKIVSIDIPSGYDGGSGLQNFTVALNRVDYILCSYTWPLTSLHALKNVIKCQETEETVIMVDCGFPKNVYLQRNSLRKFHNVDTFVNRGSIALTL
ncbi:Edc3p KNAG_0H01630 [Huiozyma naganishii CBS 8797]|uniref:Enhancer of mRNA-decapping protein 3 n=1 Tax=Huiozyma naganishii (strain ATCC MYA-139 / BCRC 22969 / CBS 8797 / KCTC 17520 / NBRC 10181 / NCYC 3082 / Yp74L-3) TaxID=1071383 RepID=J7RPF9_HUIN7|nr:hypothetical protein KNAG_0H01630 [Kazachstania naganishii CBS 8797]CCK71578.1 hypothetical protein KNAG_0H01630 [Kazachstania naganishii CBS 8797]